MPALYPWFRRLLAACLLAGALAGLPLAAQVFAAEGQTAGAQLELIPPAVGAVAEWNEYRLQLSLPSGGALPPGTQLGLRAAGPSGSAAPQLAYASAPEAWQVLSLTAVGGTWEAVLPVDTAQATQDVLLRLKSSFSGSWTLAARLVDKSSLLAEAQVVVDYYHRPVLVAQPILTKEHREAGTLLADLTCADGDPGDNCVFQLLAPVPGPVALSPAGKLTVNDPAALCFEHSAALTVQVQVTDLHGLSSIDELVVELENINEAPLALAEVPGHSLPAWSTLTWQLPGSLFADPDGSQALVYALTLPNGAPLPDFLRFDPQALTLTAAPSGADQGTYLLRLAAYDPAGLSGAQTFTLSVTYDGTRIFLPLTRRGR